ncbi:hypothetical protein GCM10009688_21500 [Arthrobacter gandavensis]|uniref:Uncharacterized protein n=1 Tax=Arthrobacter gandavensis TaxID=169960 RepID=A0ABN2PA90_9MICC
MRAYLHRPVSGVAYQQGDAWPAGVYLNVLLLMVITWGAQHDLSFPSGAGSLYLVVGGGPSVPASRGGVAVRMAGSYAVGV